MSCHDRDDEVGTRACRPVVARCPGASRRAAHGGSSHATAFRRLTMKCAAAHLRDLPREVGRLAGTFNAVLERPRAAFKAQQLFVADASQELRTPLATIR